MHISIIEDDLRLWQKMSHKLIKEWYTVSLFGGYSDFMEPWANISHLYIVDIWLWDGSGFDIIDWLRNIQHSAVPILITSGYGDTDRIVYWLNIWADDYMIKPCIPDEFIARVNALARRKSNGRHNKKVTGSFIYKDITYTPETQTIIQQWKNINLSKRELAIFELFIRNPKNVFSREAIVKHGWYWEESCDISDTRLNTALSRIRKKFWSSFNMKCLYNCGYILD